MMITLMASETAGLVVQQSEIMDKLLTVKELQELIGCGRNKIYEILATNTIRKIKIGKQYYIPQSEYERWIKSNLGKEIIL